MDPVGAQLRGWRESLDHWSTEHRSPWKAAADDQRPATTMCMMAADATGRILGIHHVQITIPPGKDADRVARSFYIELLELPEVPKPAELFGRGGFWIKVGDRDLHIGVEDEGDRSRRKGHVAYEVDDLEDWRTRLTRRGHETIDSVQFPGWKRFELRDPFGNRLELIQRADP